MENIEIEISSDEKTLIKSDTLLLNSSEFKVQISELVIEFCFVDDENRKKPGITARATDNEQKLETKLINYNKNNGGFLEPIAIGSLNGQDLYLSYWVQIINAEKHKRIFTFNLSVGEEND
jgi:hypothetical protein